MRIEDGDPAAEPRAVTWLGFDGRTDLLEREVAAEVPVSIAYGTVPYAVMMATPADFLDFAVGFSLSEGVIGARAEIRGVAVEPAETGVSVRIDLVPERFHAVLARRRTMAGRTSCGVCGIEDAAQLPRADRARAAGAAAGVAAVAPGLESVRRALRELPAHQPLNARTRAVHGAAWAGHDGGILLAREDVGRHNALDKLVGALLSRGTDPSSGFVLVTSRVSFEMVEKVAAFGAGALVAISAPTTLGLARAREHGIALLAIARADGVTAFG